MRILRQAVLFFILFCLCVTLFPTEKTGRIVHVGLYQNEPKIFRDSDGKAAGIFPEILEEIARKESWTIEYHEFSWDQCLKKLDTGEINLMPDVAHSIDRGKRFDFPAEEVVSSWNAIYTNKKVNVNSLNDLDGLRIAVLKGSIQQPVLEQMMSGFGCSPVFIEVKSFEEAFMLTSNYKADVLAVNHFYGDYFYQRYRLKKTPVIFDPASLYFVTARGKNTDLLKAIEKHLKTMKSEPGSAYYQILGKWMLHDPLPVLSPLVTGTIISISALFILALLFILLLRWQVKGALNKQKKITEQLGLIGDHLQNGYIFQIDLGKDGCSRKFLYIGAGVKSVNGLSPQQIYKNADILYRQTHPDDVERLKDCEKNAFQSMSTFNIETRIIIPGRSTRWLQITSTPHRESNSHIIFDGIALDITERKLAELRIQQNLKEKAALLKEIHHRVKNNMAVVTSLLNLQAKRIENKEQALAAFEESCGRISAMAQIHEQLYRSEDFAEIDMKYYLKSMIPKVKRACHVFNTIDIKVNVENVFLGIDSGVPCGLIINELITNSFKHAFQNRKKGHLLIDFRKLSDTSYRLIVQDDGVGMPGNIDAYKSETFGLNLIRILTEQIEGTLEIKRLKKGTKFVIRFS